MDADGIDCSDVVAHDKLNCLGVQLEKNQVGRVLLRPDVLKDIPSGLWAFVLERAARKKTKFFEDESKDRPPLDGLYFLIQNLLPDGVIYRNFPVTPQKRPFCSRDA